jgi:hypothetical protein
MPSYLVNWSKRIRELIPYDRRDEVSLAFAEVLISQQKQIHASFLTWRGEIIYALGFTGQIIYLEKILNDKWDNVSRGIYINNTADVYRTYLYNKAELKQPLFLYNKWTGSVLYNPGDLVIYANKVYQAQVLTSGNQPDISPEWAVYKNTKVFLKNKTEYQTQYDFIVMVPISVTFDINEMKALINYYKLAGKRYIIQTY